MKLASASHASVTQIKLKPSKYVTRDRKGKQNGNLLTYYYVRAFVVAFGHRCGFSDLIFFSEKCLKEQRNWRWGLDCTPPAASASLTVEPRQDVFISKLASN